MSDTSGVVISAAVEGIVDEAVIRRLIAHAGAASDAVYGRQGKRHLRQRILGYNEAARRTPWVVLVDLDNDNCAPPLRDAWIPVPPAPGLCFRVAVREVEAWLIADADGLSQFLHVARTRVPRDPEALVDPKNAMVNLARASRLWDLREDMVPHQHSGREVGRAYSSRLIEFASSSWSPEVGSRHSDSLRRAIECLQRLVENAG